MYFIPNENGSIEEGSRIFNWAAYVHLAEEDLGEFMIDRNRRFNDGTLPPGHIRLSEEKRLKALVTVASKLLERCEKRIGRHAGL